MTANATIKDYLDCDGQSYKQSMGTSGPQLNVHYCPFCGNQNWKVYVNEERGLGNCFVCNQTFNLFQFVKASSKCTSNREVFEILRKVGGEAAFMSTQNRPQIVIDEGPFQLPASVELDSLQFRSLPDHYAREFKLMYSEYGLWETKLDNGENYTQLFDQMIIIPVFDLDGGLVTFQGRYIGDDKNRKRYLFPAGLPGTGVFLYNAHVALQRTSSTLIVGEGAFDVIAIQNMIDKFGIIGATAIGTFGKQLSGGTGQFGSQVSRLRLLKGEGVKSIIFAWDGENPAYQSALKAARTCLKIGLRPSIMLLPRGQDPNEADVSALYKSYQQRKPVTLDSISVLMLESPYV